MEDSLNMNGGAVSDLLKTNQFSPLVIYGIMVAVSAIIVYTVRNDLHSYNNSKIKKIADLYMWHELSL